MGNPNPNAPDFELSLGDLQDHLPTWWQTQNPASQIYAIISALATVLDQLSADYEQVYLDQDIETASYTGLVRNFALAWGLTNETLPTVTGQLAAYIQARSIENGSIASLINTLLGIIGPQSGGTILTFPGGGGGLTFPASGGFTLWQFTQSYDPSVTTFPLIFPVDGSGLEFPTDGVGLTLYNWNTASPNPSTVFPIDGSGLLFPDNGLGIIFGTYGFLNIKPNYSTYQLTVQVLEYLQFDLGAFTRAVDRFNPADWLPPIVQSVPAFF